MRRVGKHGFVDVVVGSVLVWAITTNRSVLVLLMEYLVLAQLQQRDPCLHVRVQHSLHQVDQVLTVAGSSGAFDGLPTLGQLDHFVVNFLEVSAELDWLFEEDEVEYDAQLSRIK